MQRKETKQNKHLPQMRSCHPIFIWSYKNSVDWPQQTLGSSTSMHVSKENCVTGENGSQWTRGITSPVPKLFNTVRWASIQLATVSHSWTELISPPPHPGCEKNNPMKSAGKIRWKIIQKKQRTATIQHSVSLECYDENKFPKGMCRWPCACQRKLSSGSHTCVRSTVLGPPTSHVLSLHWSGALGGAPWVLELGLPVELKIFLYVEHRHRITLNKLPKTLYYSFKKSISDWFE